MEEGEGVVLRDDGRGAVSEGDAGRLVERVGPSAAAASSAICATVSGAGACMRSTLAAPASPSSGAEPGSRDEMGRIVDFGDHFVPRPPRGDGGTRQRRVRRTSRRARSRRGVVGRQDEAVADVADGADVVLVLGAELGAEAAHVDVDGAGAAEVVVAPDLLEQLRAGEDAARVLGEVLQELELLEGQVERAAADASRCTSRRRRHLAGRMTCASGSSACAAAAQARWRAGAGPRARPGRRCGGRTSSMPQSWATTARPPSVTMSRTGGVGAGGAHQPAQVARRRRGPGAVDEDEVGVGASSSALPWAGNDLHAVCDSSASPGSTSRRAGGGP